MPAFAFPRRLRPTPIAAALVLLCSSAAAQTTPADGQQQIVVTGIRASLQRSITAKQNAATNVEVVSAEDVGKMPDKNIADALSRLAGVNVAYGGALAMDEAERIAIRGTSPNLNLTTINGHALSSGDWHVGDQSSSGRSVGFGLMPSQLIGQAVVYKTAQADITEGGIAGTVDIRTRKPLDFRQRFSGELALGAVHATLPGKTDPQASALLAWKNDAGTLGVLVQAFKEDRHLRRDGEETFSYQAISPSSAAATANPALAGKFMPGSLNSALFEGVRQRSGGYLGLQFKPSDRLDANLSAFRSVLKADNYNSSAYALPAGLVNAGWDVVDPVIQGNLVTSATLRRPAGSAANVIAMQFDHILRSGAKSLSSFYDLDARFKATDALSFSGRYGYTKGYGVTQSQPTLTFGLLNAGMRYRIHGDRPTDYVMLDANGQPIDLGNVNNFRLMQPIAASVSSTDSERYLHLDGEYKLASGFVSAVKFGARTALHRRQYKVLAARWNAQDDPNVGPGSLFTNVTGGSLVNTSFVPPSDIPVPGTRYPGDFASGLNADFPRQLFRFHPDQIRQFNAGRVNWADPQNQVWTSGYTVQERNNALYGMVDFELDDFSGNAGLRVAETNVTSVAYQSLAGRCVALQPCSVPGAIVGSRFGSYLPQVTTTSHTVLLPSLNLRWAVAPKWVARLGTSRTLGRPNYNELAGAVTLNNALLTGSSGNPRLRPITSTNVDASLAWYFAPRAYVSAGVFSQHLQNYVKTGVSKVEFFNIDRGVNTVYDVTSRYGVKARLQGVELAGELPIGAGFGVGANLTYVDSKDQDGFEMLGTSKLTYNLQGYYEDDRLSARVAWNHRSSYADIFLGSANNIANASPVNGQRRYAGYGSLSASIGWKLNPHLSIHLDGNNLNDPVRHNHATTEAAPMYWHQSGRQFFLNLRAKL